MTQETIC